MYGVIMAISSTTVLLIFIVIWAIILVYDKIKNNSNKNSNIDNNIEENNNNNNNNENNKNNHGLKIYYGIFGVLRTSAGFKIINSIGKYKFWRPISLALIPLCAIISLLTLYMFIVSTINLFSGTVPKESSKPVIFLFGNLIPWIPGIIALIIGITFHELAHGIIAKAYNLKIKSTGLLLGLGIPLGAFVELGDDFKDTTNKIRGAVASAGPMANVIIFIISLMVMPFVMGLSTPLTISNVIDGYPADNILFKGDKIISINNHKINSLVDFNNVVKDVKPNEKIEITILRNNNNNIITYTIPTSKDGLIGINVEPSPTISFILQTLYWTSMLNLMLGFFNLLPAAPLDGFHIWNALPDLIRELKKDNKILNTIANLLNWIINDRSLVSISLMVWGLILFSILYSFM